MKGYFFMVRGECVVSCECRVYEVCFLMILRHESLLRGFPDFTIDYNPIYLTLIQIFYYILYRFRLFQNFQTFNLLSCLDFPFSCDFWIDIF